jgi:hypothetical protein
MQPDYSPIINAIYSEIGKLLPFVIPVIVFVIAFTWLEGRLNRKKRRRWRGSRWGRADKGRVYPFQPKHDSLPGRSMDAADQLRTVMRADFKPQALLNKSEARLFKVLDKMVTEMAPPGWQVMAQVISFAFQCRPHVVYAQVAHNPVENLGDHGRL